MEDDAVSPMPHQNGQIPCDATAGATHKGIGQESSTPQGHGSLLDPNHRPGEKT